MAWGPVLVAAVVMAGPAAVFAAHPTQLCLDIEPDETYATSNDDVIEALQAHPGGTDAGHPPEHEGCVTGLVEPGQDWDGTNIDFEIVGVADPDSSDTPATPDMTCTIPAGTDNCTVHPPPSGGGSQVIRAWIDLDGSDVTVEADMAEGYDESASPGDQGEPDTTDVSQWIWTHMDSEPLPCGADGVCWRKITVDYKQRKGTFFGAIFNEGPSCRESVIRVKKVRRSRPDKIVAKATDSDGEWRIRTFDSHRGRYYAVLARSVLPIRDGDPSTYYECSRARTRNITLN